MTLARAFLVTSLVLFGTIAVAFTVKKYGAASNPVVVENVPIAIHLPPVASPPPEAPKTAVAVAPIERPKEIPPAPPPPAKDPLPPRAPVVLPDADRMELLFQPNSPLPIVETIVYKSRVPWKSGKSAWLIDYAAHYHTHVHFLCRSISRTKSYTANSIRNGELFNVLKSDKEVTFYLVVDISRCRMWLYSLRAMDQGKESERYLLKSYEVGLGRKDPSRHSGCLTPRGIYTLGPRVAIFQPKMMGMHHNKKIEWIRVFGTRWIPFEKEVAGCSEPAKGFGIHGAPWAENPQNGMLCASGEGIGAYESDGCIRMRTPEVEELFAVIAGRATTICLVSDFREANLPGVEVTY